MRINPIQALIVVLLVIILVVLVTGRSIADGGFTDVPNNHPHVQAIDWATGTGLVEGFGDGTFRPNESITRAQMVTILHRYHFGEARVAGEPDRWVWPDE